MKCDVWKREEMEERTRELKQRAAAGAGEASVLLEKYDGHFTMLAYRERSGSAELHRDWADLFVILDGAATLLTGGAIEAPHTVDDGETRGTGLKNGESRAVRAGDVLHIPAGLNHQMLLDAGAAVTYFVVKTRQGR